MASIDETRPSTAAGTSARLARTEGTGDCMWRVRSGTSAVLEEAHEYCVQSPDGAGSPWSIRVQVGLPPPERLVGLADQLQEWEIEELAAAGRPATNK